MGQSICCFFYFFCSTCSTFLPCHHAMFTFFFLKHSIFISFNCISSLKRMHTNAKNEYQGRHLPYLSSSPLVSTCYLHFSKISCGCLFYVSDVDDGVFFVHDTNSLLIANNLKDAMHFDIMKIS